MTVVFCTARSGRGRPRTQLAHRDPCVARIARLPDQRTRSRSPRSTMSSSASPSSRRCATTRLRVRRCGGEGRSPPLPGRTRCRRQGLRWAIAYNPPEEQTTTLLDIGLDRAVGSRHPVRGARPGLRRRRHRRHRHLHNQDQVAAKDVRPGDTVIVRRAGDVIPEVVGPVLSDRDPLSQPGCFPRTVRCAASGWFVMRPPPQPIA